MEPPVSILLPAAGLIILLGSIFALTRLRRQGGDPSIVVVAVGGGGIEAASTMARAGVRRAVYVAVDSDRIALDDSKASTKVAIGQSPTGSGSGGNTSSAESAVREASDEIARATAGAELVVIVVALGGGTGSGAAPVVAEIARKQGALTMAVVTEPFGFEGARRSQVAARAATALANKVDAMATVASDGVRETMPAEITAVDAFRAVDGVVLRNVGEILDLLAVRGRINLDLSHFRAMLEGSGAAAVGFGRASGPNRAVDAAAKALASTLLGKRLPAATSVLVNVTGSRNLKLAELDAVIESVLGAVASGADLTFGMAVNPRLRGEVQVTLLVTGFESRRPAEAEQDASTGSVPWRPVWLRRATENGALASASPSPAVVQAPGPDETATSSPDASVPAGSTEEEAAAAKAPTTKRQKRAAARARRKSDKPQDDPVRSAPLRFP